MRLVLIALAGAVGTLCRYGTQLLTIRIFPGVGPLGTVAINATGCFILGVLAGAGAANWRVHDDARLAIAVGFCGGLTTYSSFNQDLVDLVRVGRWTAALGVLAATLVLGLAGSAAGFRVGHAVASATAPATSGR